VPVLIDDHLQMLRIEGVAFVDLAEQAGLEADVPSCPGWRVRDLVGHVGSVHRWATAIVSAPPASGRVPMPQPPIDDLVGWYRDGHRRLLNVLTGLADDAECWTFLPAPTPKAFWVRRQAHETAVHRADAAATVGAPVRYPGEFALDGIDELLFGFLDRSRSHLLADPPVTVLVAPVDADVWWHVTVLPDRREIRTSGDRDAACVVAGSASDLYLLLWNRTPEQAVEVTGDASILDLWRERATV
jgi:uncharacterized protein (TIGR03083 family)